MKQLWYSLGWVALMILLFSPHYVPGETLWDVWSGVIATILIVLLLWPAHARATDMFAARKKSWISRLLSPLRDVHRRFAPQDRLLLRATRRWLFIALVAIYLLAILARVVPGLARVLLWPVIELGVPAVLIGRALSFWIADRRAAVPPESKMPGQV